MAVSVTLSTVPGKLTREDHYTSSTIEVFGPSLATETIAALSSTADIRTAVARFGAKVRADHPDASFYVSIRLAKGNRKPNGYDAASRGNGLGQEDFMQVDDRRTKPAVPSDTPVQQAPA